MTKAYFQALAYGQESRERQELANRALDCYGPMLRDFILGQGCFSQAEQIQAARRVGEKIAEKAKKAINEQFAKEFNDHKANAVVEVPIPQKKNPMPHAWSSDPDRDAKVRMEEDGRTKPYRTLTELLRDEGAVVSKSDPLMAAREQLEVANNAQLAAARERDRADEARARYRKRWQERGRTIAKLQARLHERKASGVNSTLAGWCRVVQSQRTEAVSHAAACRKEVFGLRKLVSDYEDRVGELNLKVNRLEGDLDLAVQSHANATERRLKAEARVAELEAQVNRDHQSLALLSSARTKLIERVDELEKEQDIYRAGQFASPEAPDVPKCPERESVTKRMPPWPGGSGNVTGLRTERVTLEITHSEFFGVREWSWQTILRLLHGESVRVVEEFGAALPSVVEDMAAEIKRLDAERDEAKQRHLRECEKCSALADKVIGLKARVAELESAPAASGAAGTEVGNG